MEQLFTLILWNIDMTADDPTLQMILIMSGIRTALIGIIVIVFEWRALVGHWRLKSLPANPQWT
ncbi:hypothetical protein ACT4MK_02060 (plasmid) [Bradyrhizobium barranii]|uniref:hypothetical protein n=1 Tax=Bradyrhizobium TaxID=374 RepID=UPI003F2732A5